MKTFKDFLTESNNLKSSPFYKLSSTEKSKLITDYFKAWSHDESLMRSFAKHFKIGDDHVTAVKNYFLKNQDDFVAGVLGEDVREHQEFIDSYK